LYKVLTTNKLLLRRADCTALSVIAMQHVDDGYSRQGNFVSLLIHTRWHQYLWFKRWGVWGHRLSV